MRAKIFKFPWPPRLVIVKTPQPPHALGAFSLLFDRKHTQRSTKRFIRNQAAIAEAEPIKERKE